MKIRLMLFSVTVFLGIAGSLPAHATVGFCGAHFSPTPETSRYVFSDFFTGTDSKPAYERQFLKAVENQYGLGAAATNSYGQALTVYCNFWDTADEARRGRDDDWGEASRYVNSNGAVQVLKYHWIPEDTIRVSE